MIDKVDAWQVFWSILIALMSYIAIMITFFRKELKEVRAEAERRVLIIMCDKYRLECEKDCKESRDQRDKYIDRVYSDATGACHKVHEDMLKTAHSHASSGNAGEVVK